MDIDVSQEIPSRVFIQVSNRCILQAVVYEDLPMYCTSCSRLGHKSVTCGKDAPVEDHPQNSAPLPTSKTTVIKEKTQRWRPKSPYANKEDALTLCSISMLSFIMLANMTN